MFGAALLAYGGVYEPRALTYRTTVMNVSSRFTFTAGTVAAGDIGIIFDFKKNTGTTLPGTATSITSFTSSGDGLGNNYYCEVGYQILTNTDVSTGISTTSRFISVYRPTNAINTVSAGSIPQPKYNYSTSPLTNTAYLNNTTDAYTTIAFLIDENNLAATTTSTVTPDYDVAYYSPDNGSRIKIFNHLTEGTSNPASNSTVGIAGTTGSGHGRLSGSFQVIFR